MIEHYEFKSGDLASYRPSVGNEVIVEVVGPCTVFGVPMYQINLLPLGSGVEYVAPDRLSRLKSDLFVNEQPQKQLAIPEATVIRCECGGDKLQLAHYSWCPKHIKRSI